MSRKPRSEIALNAPDQVGRPPITLEDLPPGWQAMLYQIYTEGGDDIEARAAIPVHGRIMSAQAFYSLMDREPEFAQTIKDGRVMSYCWLNQTLRKGMCMGKDFNATVAIWYAANKFPEVFARNPEPVHQRADDAIVIQPVFGDRQISEEEPG